MNNVHFGSSTGKSADYSAKSEKTGKNNSFVSHNATSTTTPVRSYTTPIDSGARIILGDDGDIIEVRGPKYGMKPETRSVSSYMDDDGKISQNDDGDSVQIKNKTTREERLERQRKAKKAAAWKNRFIGAAAALAITAGAMGIGGKIEPAKPNFDASNHTVVEVAEWSGVDERAIILANSIENKDVPLGDIILPSEYGMYSNDISEIIQKLNNPDLSDDKRENLEQQLKVLVEKQDKQDKLATLYVDDNEKFAYIIPNERGIYAETIKDAFGIKDGVIKTYNSNIEYEWGTDGTEDMEGHYRDYTYSTIPTSGIKVPYSALGKTNM